MKIVRLVFTYVIGIIVLSVWGSCVINADADIIKLKRGVSFEGKLVEETDDEYTFELSVGLVTFKKSDVEAVELYAEIENLKMAEDWNFSSVQDVSDDDNDSDGMDTNYENDINTEEDDLVKYKGRYITPEVYEIIEKERDIQKKRYNFLLEQKNKQQREDLEKRTVGKITKNNHVLSQVQPDTSFSKASQKNYGQSKKEGADTVERERPYQQYLGDKTRNFGYEGSL